MQVHIHDIQVHTVHLDDLVLVHHLDDDSIVDEVEEAVDEVDGKFVYKKNPDMKFHAGFCLFVISVSVFQACTTSRPHNTQSRNSES